MIIIAAKTRASSSCTFLRALPQRLDALLSDPSSTPSRFLYSKSYLQVPLGLTQYWPGDSFYDSLVLPSKVIAINTVQAERQCITSIRASQGISPFYHRSHWFVDACQWLSHYDLTVSLAITVAVAFGDGIPNLGVVNLSLQCISTDPSESLLLQMSFGKQASSSFLSSFEESNNPQGQVYRRN